MDTQAKIVARIFQEPTGKWHVCDDAADYLDARGTGYNSRREAIAVLRAYAGKEGGYTHYLSGCRPRALLAKHGKGA